MNSNFLGEKGKIVLVSFLFFGFTNMVFGQYSGGDGSAEDPWRISCKADLLEMGERTEHYDDCFVMTADVNLAGEVFDTAIISKKGTEAFSGVFDGNGFEITNLNIDGGENDRLGLFGQVRDGEIRNLGIEDFFVSGSGYVAGLAGRCFDSNFTNCYSTGQASGTHSVGGLIGYLYGESVSDCFTDVTINGELIAVGGLVGTGVGVTFSKCHSFSIVCGCDYVGGLIGANDGSVMYNCYAKGEVYGANDKVGGLVGLGGGSTYNSYFIGSVNGRDYVGGLVGDNWGNIFNCFSASDVNGAGNYVGCLAGYNYHDISNSFWNIEKQTHGVTQGVGFNDPDGTVTNVSGLTTSQMQQKTTYTTSPANWDFTNIWGIGENQTYPFLRQYPASDINQDNIVDYLDLALLAENWLQVN